MLDVAVIGAGVIGRSIAWRIAQTGQKVACISDDSPAASFVAAGMLAPFSEYWPGEEQAVELGVEALGLWPDFAAELGVGLQSSGTLLVAVDAADATVLRQLTERETLLGSQLRDLEPALGFGVRSGVLIPEDLAVDNRKLLTALAKAGEAAGVQEISATVTSIDELKELARTVVIAAGAYSNRLHPALRHRIRPIKGEILRLRPRLGSIPGPRHVIRAFVEGRPLYAVPRLDGELVIGATQYEVGFDVEPQVSGVHDLLADAIRLLPGVCDYSLVEVAAGVRAGSTENVPIIEWLEDGVLACTGHHRNGLLLAPWSARQVVERLTRASAG